MEGLEAKEINLSKLKKENRTFRFDSTYFVKKALNFENLIKSKPHFYLKENEVVSGPFGSTLKSHAYQSHGVPFVRVTNIKGGFQINKSEIIFISEEDNSRIKNSELQVDDVVLSKVGNTIGYYARVDEEIGRCNVSENNIAIKLINYNTALKHYILAYLNTKYGFLLTTRRISGNAQPKLNVFDISEIPIPEFSDQLYSQISKVILVSRKLRLKSEEQYKCGESILLNGVGLSNFSPSDENKNIKTFSESFLSSSRLDAEYYQPKYEEYEKAVKSYGKGHTTIGEAFKHIKLNSKKDRKEYKYIEIGDVNVGDGSNNYTTRITENLPANAKYEVKKGDLLISKVRPNRGAVSIINYDEPDIIVSGAFTVLRCKKDSCFSNEMLQVLCRTPVYKDWLLKFNVGTQYPVIKDEDILSLPIPKLDEDIQNTISQKIRGSHESKILSDSLLEVAKRAVEIAIEEDEQAAEKYINDQCSKLGVDLKED